MSNTSEEYKGTSSEEDSRAEGATVANFFEDHGFEVEKVSSSWADAGTITLKKAESVTDWDVRLGVTITEARELQLFKGQDGSDEAKAAVGAFEDLTYAISDLEEVINSKLSVFEKLMRAWVEKRRAEVEKEEKKHIAVMKKYEQADEQLRNEKKKRKTCK